ncbi:MAG: HD domain-containing protein [Opitutaceae bacterium]|nr:HD domain-containing protein [Opitutaceae bacterium]
MKTKAFQYPWQEMVQRLRATCEAFDPDLAGHQERVSVAAAALAGRLGLPAARVERIRIAAGLHDLGKIGVSREVLHRNGRLSAKELAAVRLHPVIGHQLLDGSEWPEIRCAADVALSHHECWDGTGYPHGLAGKEISLEARVVAIADVFDALRSQRAYKEAWTDERVILEMKRERATHFDPDLFDVCFAAVMEG